MTKSLKQISWQTSEEEYRRDKSLSYSTIAKFKRVGFNGLNTLFDRIETPSLTFGSAIDSLITGSEEEFNERFMVADFPSIPDSRITVVKALFNEFCDTCESVGSIPVADIIRVASYSNFQNNWKPETRAKVIKEECSEYYKLLYLAKGREIISASTYKDILDTVEALKTSSATKWYFQKDTPFENTERLYQLKFKHAFNDVDYRCMADELIILHDEKRVIPIDLKTSSKPEWDFYKSFVDWDYMIQARLYWRIIRACMDEDPYFKDFVLEDYRFIVVNKATLTPLVWEYADTTKYGPLMYGKNNAIECPDPFKLGKELQGYLAQHPDIPNGICTTEPNSLTYWLNKL